MSKNKQIICTNCQHQEWYHLNNDHCAFQSDITQQTEGSNYRQSYQNDSNKSHSNSGIDYDAGIEL